MLLFQIDGYNNFVASVPDEALFLTLDSFTFLKPILLECYQAGFQIGENYNKVYSKVEANPEVVRTNFEQEIARILANSVAVYSQVYYKDMVHLNKLFGDLVYRTLIREEPVE